MIEVNREARQSQQTFSSVVACCLHCKGSTGDFRYALVTTIWFKDRLAGRFLAGATIYLGNH